MGIAKEIVRITNDVEDLGLIKSVRLLPIWAFIPKGSAEDVRVSVLVDVRLVRTLGIKFVGQQDALPGNEGLCLKQGQAEESEENLAFHGWAGG
jgi:hypothetical protein